MDRTDGSREDQLQMLDDPEQMAEMRRRIAALRANPPAPVMTREQFDEEFPA